MKTCSNKLMNKRLISFSEKSVVSDMLKLLNEKNNILSLSVGQPDFNPPKCVIKELKNIKNFKYPDPQGNKKLRELISSKLSKENNIRAEPSEVIITVGGMEAVNMVLITILNKDDECLVPNPGFLAYSQLVNIYGKNSYYSSISELENKAESAKAVIVNSPSNPTGKVYSKKELKKIASIAYENDLWIISDEVYEKFVYEKKHYSIGEFCPEKTITINSFSKTYAMPGVRIGYMHSKNDELLNIIKNLHLYTTVGASSISQELAITAIKNSPEIYINNACREYRNRRDYIINEINNSEKIILDYKPEGAFYIFAKINEDDKEYALKLLKEHNIMIMPGSIFGPAGKNHVRISYASNMNVIKKSLKKII